jgi:two-component system chemotaxis sensor kinase CheA
MSGFDHLKGTYFEECAELLEAAYGHLAAIDEGRADNETIHAVFRAIHSIKGGGGAFGFERMVAFAHALESVLDLLRDGRLALSREIAGLLLKSTDILGDLVDAARTGTDRPAGFEAGALAALRRDAGGAGHAPAAPVQHAPPPAASRLRHLRIRIAPHPGLFRSANEPLLLIRQLRRLGDATVEAGITHLPDLDMMDAESAYLAWTVDLLTAAEPAQITEIFDFVDDCCDIDIAEPTPAAIAAPAGIPPPEAASLAAPNTADGTMTETARPGAQKSGAAAHASIRVDVEKVDRLVNLVGEMVINQAMLVQLGGQLPPDMCAGLLSGMEAMSQHLRELQEAVMAVRAQPVKSVFARMPRLVRELSAQLGKDVRLVLTGEGTEIDKTVIEQLADPLTHMLRNALDHGLETPAQREAAGKPRQGTITLGAAHRSGRIVIDMEDDGSGIARDRVLQKARAQGLVAPDAALSDDEIDNLIFAPGFSTAATVSDISGRGVGMDVVRRNIQALGGRVSVSSVPGRGARFTLSLPLTLAILDGMVVGVGRECYIIPVTTIVESLRPKPGQIHDVAGHGDVLALRGDYVKLIYLHRRFIVPDAVHDPCRGIVVIVESEGGQRIGLVVDDLLTQQQVVVKSLEANYGAVEGIGGATILGDGRVALIIDVSRLDTDANLPLPLAAEGRGPPRSGRKGEGSPLGKSQTPHSLALPQSAPN